MSATLSLKLKTSRDELNRITAAIERIGQYDNWSEDLKSRVNLGLEEIGINIINYAFDDGLREFDITVTSEVDSVTIEIIDDRRPFDPFKDAPSADLASPLERRPVGGLGTYLVRSMMDVSTYRRVRGMNRLTLVARRAEK